MNFNELRSLLKTPASAQVAQIDIENAKEFTEDLTINDLFNLLMTPEIHKSFIPLLINRLEEKGAQENLTASMRNVLDKYQERSRHIGC